MARSKRVRIVGLAPNTKIRLVGDWRSKPLDGIVETCRLEGALNKALHEQVALARSCGHTWNEIGQALGVSRQSAWERFSAAD